MKQNFIIIILSKERTQWSELPALLLKIIFINSFILNSDQLGKLFCFLLPAHIMDIKDFLSRLKCIRKVSLTGSALSRQCTPAEAPWEGDGIFFLTIWALQRPSNYSLGAGFRGHREHVCHLNRRTVFQSARKRSSGQSSGGFSPAHPHFQWVSNKTQNIFICMTERIFLPLTISDYFY